jgi:hypothetical protein
MMSTDLFTPTSAPTAKVTLMHKHSKMLTSQVPLASANRKMVEQTLRSMEKRQKSENTERYASVSDQARLIQTLKDQQKSVGLSPSQTIVLNKHTYRNTISFPMAAMTPSVKAASYYQNKRESLESANS